MKKVMGILIALTAIGVAVRAINKNKNFISVSELESGKLDISDGVVTFNVQELLLNGEPFNHENL